MINVSGLFKQALYNDKRVYREEVTITLADNTVLNLTNQHIWGGSLSFDDAVSADNDFQLGAAIVNKQELTINNIYGDFSSYDFAGAEVVTKIGLVVDESTSMVEKIQKGRFIVDEADYNDTYISLKLLDYMSKFDKQFTTSICSFPNTAQTIITSICTACGVTLGSNTFPNYSTVIATAPNEESTSCRDMISWIAQICGCYARCDATGKLQLKWYNRAGLESAMSGLDGGIFDNPTTSSAYTSGDSASGGTFNPWDTGTAYDGGLFSEWANDIHYFSSTFSHSVSVDDVVITGVRILVKPQDNETSSDIITHFTGSAGYVVEISNNPLITEDNVSTILSRLGTLLIGFTFRKANLTVPSDPSIEAGDVGIYFDKNGNHHPIVISRVTFCPGDSQTIVSAAQTPARNSSERYSAETKNYVALRKSVQAEMSARELAVQSLEQAIEGANGLYYTAVVDQSTQATVHYLHNKGPNGTSTDHSGLNSSDIRIMISDVGVTMTANGTSPNPTWYGLTVDGVLIASILNAIGVNADWINAGSLSLGGTAQQGFSRNGAIKIYNSSGTLIGQWDKDGVQILAGSINLGSGVFQVSTSGVLSATGASISGVLTTGAGSSISNIHVSDTGIYSNNYSTIDSYNTGNRTGFFFGNDGQISLKTTSGSILRYENDSFGIFGHTGSGTSEREVSIWNNPDYAGSTGDHGVKISTYSDLMSLTERYFCVGNRSHSSQSSLYAELRPYDGAGLSMYHYIFYGNMYVSGRSHVVGDFTVDGAKSRIVDTEDYGDRRLYCYETPTPMFGDIGDGVIGDDGLCYIQIDPTFSQTASTDIEYQVFLQAYGQGNVFVKERHGTYFVVQGTPNLAFGWELKAKQRDYEMLRLDKQTDYADTKTTDYGELAYQHIDEIKQERMGEAA